MVLDWTEKKNKKHIPLVTFALGCFVGAICMKFYLEKQAKKMEDGGFVESPPIQSAMPAPQIQAVSAPVVATAPILSDMSIAPM